MRDPSPGDVLLLSPGPMIFVHPDDPMSGAEVDLERRSRVDTDELVLVIARHPANVLRECNERWFYVLCSGRLGWVEASTGWVREAWRGRP